ncbi:uncharacterized protein LOC135829307 [Sycon ciliatum]|uniref:uncharacterized protein LOC135829307 n=1 Tax=Sycon ciliatum TaxID=27933 RepID=UPI0031F6522F
MSDNEQPAPALEANAAPDQAANPAGNAGPPDAPAQDGPAARTIAPVNFKLPPFWPGDPQLWFAQAEAHFSNHRINTSRARYNVIVSSLAPEFATEIRDLLIAPPEDEPYAKLRAALTTRTQKSEQIRLRELLSTADVGDSKPSKVLRRMQQLLGGKSLDPSILRELFVQRLPPAVRQILAATPTTLSLEELAALADKVAESTVPSANTQVHAVSEKATSKTAAVGSTASSATTCFSPSSDSTTQLSLLRSDLDKLCLTVQALTKVRSRGHDDCPIKTAGFPTRDRRTGRSASRSPSRAVRIEDTDSDDVCWFHAKFGDKARRCRSPCRLSGNGTASR